jgi:hypothetical protein
MLAFVLQDMWNSKMLNLACFAPGFLTFFGQGLSNNELADSIFFGETKKFADSADSLDRRRRRPSRLC